MTCDTTELDLRYRGMLSDYLAHPDEALLERAYGLGRQALAERPRRARHGDDALAGDGSGAGLERRAIACSCRRRSSGSSSRPSRRSKSRIAAFATPTLVLHRLNDVLENQAKRIAYALHGEASQLVASVHLALADVATRLPPERVKEIQSVRGLLDQIEDRIRRISHELRPTILDDWVCVPAIEFLADGISQRWGIPVTVRGTVASSLPLTVETALYRAAQEGLTNVARTRAGHAGRGVAGAVTASHHLLGPRRRRRAVDPAVVVTPSNGRRGLGLVEIRERTAALGGTLRLVPRLEQRHGLHRRDSSGGINMGVSVLLADDHPVFRQGLRALLEREKFDVVGEASDGLEAIAAAERLQPQVVVIDLAMPALNGIDAVSRDRANVRRARRPSCSRCTPRSITSSRRCAPA